MSDVVNFDDPNHPNRFPSSDVFMSRLQADMPNEIKKLLSKGLIPEMQSAFRGVVADEQTARAHEDEDELVDKYYRAKMNWFVDEHMRQLKYTNKELEEAAFHAGEGGKDEFVKKRLEYMYNYADYDNDRARVRDKFIKEQARKTTLKDIGELLDKFLLDERAEGLKYTDNSKNGRDLLVKSAAKDFKNLDLTWSGRLL
jgi:hypothetical protein